MTHRSNSRLHCSQLLAMMFVATTVLALSPCHARASTRDLSAPFTFSDYLGIDATASGLSAADLNGDGRTEIIESQSTSNRIRIWAPDGSGAIAIVGTLSCPSPGQTVVGDFDGDGLMDIAAASNTPADSVAVFHGLGGDAFGPAQMCPAGLQPNSLASGDINGDGRPDLVVASGGTIDTFVVLINTGGAFAPPVVYAPDVPTGYEVGGMAVGDVNGDGYADVAVPKLRGVWVFHGRSDGTLDPPIAVPLVGFDGPLAFADLDGDGAVDLVVGGSASPWITVLWNDGHGGLSNAQGVFESGALFSIGHDDHAIISAADIDGDGRLDLVCASVSLSHSRVAVAWNQGSRAWDTCGLYIDDLGGNSAVHGPPLKFMTACDYDLDGFKDIVGAFAEPSAQSSLAGFRHLSPRCFAALQQYPARQPISGIWVMRLADGKPAVLLQQPDSIRVMVAEPDGRLDPPVAYLDAQGAYGLDWNGDGCRDLAIPRGDSLEIQLCGGGRKVVPALPAGTFLCNGDFNGDGLPDLLLDVSGMGNAIAYRDPQSGYATPVPISTDPISVLDGSVLAAADFDGDGLCDLAAGYSSVQTDSVTVFLNVGSSRFRRGTTMTLVPPNPYFLLTGLFALDLDADHRTDLTAITHVNAGAGLAWVYRGQGDGTLDSTPGTYDVLSENASGMVMDLNGDGLPDFATSTPNDIYNIGSFSFRANLGGASFEQTGLRHYVGRNPLPPAVGDLNGDGHLDVVFGLNEYLNTGQVSVLLNTLPPDVVTPTLISPVQAIMEGGRARIEWYSPGDLSLAGAVWRSENAGPWRELGGASSDGRGMIVFLDPTVRPGSRYAYRLDYTASGGARSTDPIELSVPAPGLSLSLALAGPNPAHGHLSVLYALPAANTATIELLDISGRRVASRKIVGASAGSATSDLGSGSHMPSGIYWVRLTQGGRSVSARTVLLP